MYNKMFSFFVRIKKIEFNNFRNIQKGCVEAPNSDIAEFTDGNPSIVGLYGQNGSGKTSVIMALGILKDVLSGKPIGDKYKSSIRYGCDRCTLSYSFVLYSKVFNDKGLAVINSKESACYEVFYSFDIARVIENSDNEPIDAITTQKEILRIENESIKYRMTNSSGKNIVPKQTFMDTHKKTLTKKSFAFGSLQKESFYTKYDENKKQQLKEFFAISLEKSQSFIFYSKTIEFLNENMISIFDAYFSMRSIQGSFPGTRHLRVFSMEITE